MRYLYSAPVFGQSVLNSTCKFPPFPLPPEKKGKPSKDLCTIDCNHKNLLLKIPDLSYHRGKLS